MRIVSKQNGVTYEYTENFWTGKRELVVDGCPLFKRSKKQFVQRLSEGEQKVYDVKGSFLTGVTLLVRDERIVLAKNAWYEWLLIFLPLIGMIYGIAFCGALGGGLSAVFCILGGVINANVLRSRKNILFKIIVCLVIAVVVNVVWFLIYYVIASAILSLV